MLGEDFSPPHALFHKSSELIGFPGWSLFLEPQEEGVDVVDYS